MKKILSYILEIVQTIRNIIAVPIIGVGRIITVLGELIMDFHF